MSNNKPVPATKTDRLSMLTGLAKQLRLVWSLFKDKRVPTWTKSVVPISLLYLISPIDFMPDVILGLGQLDDIAVILLGMTLFVKLCPPEIVQYYVNKLEYGKDFYRDDDETVDTTYRVVGED
jgi:uncharacterized membrane protein YkvA (DUF1232 family)